MTNLLETIASNGGFTYDPITDHLFDSGDPGYAIAIPGTEHIIGTTSISREQFARTFAEITSTPDLLALIENGAVVGGWYSPDRGVYMIELTSVLNGITRDEAIHFGKLRNQEAIYDLATGEEIPTGGTGG